MTAGLLGGIRIHPDYVLMESLLQEAVRILAAEPNPESQSLLTGISGITLEIEAATQQAAAQENIQSRGDAGAQEPLDWEIAVIGNPARDISYVRHQIEQMMPWEEFLAEYQRARGKLPSEQELDFYRLWRGAFSMHFAIVARSYFNAGLSSSVFLGYASQLLYQRLNHHLHESVNYICRKYG